MVGTDGEDRRGMYSQSPLRKVQLPWLPYINHQLLYEPKKIHSPRCQVWYVLYSTSHASLQMVDERDDGGVVDGWAIFCEA